MTLCKFIVCTYNLHIGTKNVSKEMTKISAGLAKNKGVSWFPELFDRRKVLVLHIKLNVVLN